LEKINTKSRFKENHVSLDTYTIYLLHSYIPYTCLMYTDIHIYNHTTGYSLKIPLLLQLHFM